MTRWDLASRLSDALERDLPAGCSVTIEVPGRDRPRREKDAFKIVARVDYQGGDGKWRVYRGGFRPTVEVSSSDADVIVACLSASIAKFITKARTRGAA